MGVVGKELIATISSFVNCFAPGMIVKPIPNHLNGTLLKNNIPIQLLVINNSVNIRK